MIHDDSSFIHDLRLRDSQPACDGERGGHEQNGQFVHRATAPSGAAGKPASVSAASNAARGWLEVTTTLRVGDRP